MTFQEWFDNQVARDFLSLQDEDDFYRTWDAAQSNKVDEIQRIMTPSTSEILLAAGEMTAAELRAVRAVLNWLKAKT